MRRIVTALLMLSPFAPAAAQTPTVELRPGMVITRSVRVVPKTYRLPAPASLASGTVTIVGDDITVDFAGAVLLGQDTSAAPDRAAGIGVLVKGGHHVRILHARIRGYRFGILARGTVGLTLRDNDVSDTWKPRLFSLVAHESLVDWLSFHHNDHDEWLRYGAGIYLSDVHGGAIRGNTGDRGMNGLLMVRTDHVSVADNEFSFNSGLGAGLYRSSDNVIVHNRLDYDVRGQSHGFYHRGQDSAALLMYEQSLRNVVAYNSATHGGDGLFVWAGQTTMDSGTGGVNDNLFYGNDFSFAPANAMEATFSRNTFIANRAEGDDYGLWGGYSYESLIAGNCFIHNRVGLAIEHGQANRILGNRFDGDTTAVSLWANPIEPSDWGYPKHRDTRSQDYHIEQNAFVGNRVALRVARTAELTVRDNAATRVDSFAVARDTTGVALGAPGDGAVAAADTDATGACVPPPAFAKLAPDLPDSERRVPSTPLARRDRSAIVVDEWGPYDWRRPKLWPVDSVHAIPLRLAVLGPPGAWRLVAQHGIATLSSSSGRIGDTIAVTPSAGARGDWDLRLTSGGVGFGFSRFEPPADWTVRVVGWRDSTDPRRHSEAFARLLHRAPLVTLRPPRLDFEWYRPSITGIPSTHWALEASGSVTLAPGRYTLRTISDDAVRVWVDGKPVIDDWTPHGSTVDVAPLAGGTHALRVRYYQVDGWTELRVEIVRGRETSRGSPGPH